MGEGDVRQGITISRVPDSDRREELRQRVDHDLTLHPPTGPEVTGTMDSLREAAKAFGTAIVELCPLSREQSTALTRLEETLFHAIAAVARGQ
jgi:hypothetical protein